jgi:steroid 5-alpha reductase family enzyme
VPAINAGVIAALFAVAWAICVAMRDVTPVDSLWGLGMGLAAVSDLCPDRRRDRAARLVLTGLCLAWALRLGGYML